MYTTWFDYGTVTNMGVNKEVLIYDNQGISETLLWWSSSSAGLNQSLYTAVNVTGIIGDRAIPSIAWYARPALCQEEIPELGCVMIKKDKEN